MSTAPASRVREIDDDLVERAVARADAWVAAAGPARGPSARLAALLADPAGVEFAMRFVDRVARPADDAVAARELARLGRRPPGFLGAADRALLRAGAAAAPRAPRLVVPAARRRMRAMVGHLVVDAGGRALGRHLAAARREGFRLNLNLLGEAVLGHEEADRRLERTLALIRRRDVDHVSVKASSVAAGLVPWDLEGSRDRLVERLVPLYRTAGEHGVFVNLDVEEYKDLDLTVALFTALAQRRDLAAIPIGVVLQGYLPDAVGVLDQLAEVAHGRVEAGGAPVKVRLVKGANLAMERVDAELHGWERAPYATKPEVDANYVRLLDRALRPERAGSLRIGVASHHTHHVALAVELAAARGVAEQLDVEMLQGMAPEQARVIAADVPSPPVLYTPVVHRADFDAAVSYLVRRLEENADPENYLHALFSGDGAASYEQRFRDSVRDRDAVAATPRRAQDRATEATRGTERQGSTPIGGISSPLSGHPPRSRDGGEGAAFRNEPDTDPSSAANRAWALRALAAPLPPVAGPELTDPAAVEAVVARARGATWHATPAGERAGVLRAAARELGAARGELLGVMAAEAGKTLAEADPEVSEAIDFAAYYADRADELAGAPFTPDRVVVVTPPWNLPVAIPLGGCLAALAAGAAVIVKPAPQSRRCAEAGVAALHRAGVPRDALQLVHADEGPAGRHLVTHEAVDHVVLTGAASTAALFRSWRPELGLIAETSGKNALVITPSADPDLAVADLVRSAFGHAGQKCSAASLAILVGSAATDRRLRRQLVDAVRTLRVGAATDPSTTMGPLIAPPGEALHRALTTLEPGERWLVEPRRLGDTLWTPGVREPVAPGSWFHRTECFGPVLGLMHARTLDEAIAWQDDTGYGLTGGLHALDPDEVEHWLSRVEVGNAYVNRHVTGAIVRRQPFGGWKGSVIGPGAKPGGPHYVAQFGTWSDPTDAAAPTPVPLSRPVKDLLESVAMTLTEPDLVWLLAAAHSDAAAWRDEFSREHDPTGLRVEGNVLRYRPLPALRVVVGEGATRRDALRVRLAAACAGVPVSTFLRPDPAATGGCIPPTADIAPREPCRPGERIRVLGSPPAGLRREAAEVGATLVDAPVVADGQRELLTVLREQAVSTTLHRFGHVEA